MLRIDNVKTAVSKGAGAWGAINETYRRFAAQLRFHVDACQPRHPRGKGKVERTVRDQREAVDPRGQVFDSLEDLQAWTDARLEKRAHHLRCPATGTSVAQAWEQERRLLTPLPETLPEPFDIVVRRPVGPDCIVNFEGRQYSVPFRFVRQEVEVRGLAGRVQMLKDCEVIAEHPRGTARLILRDEAHYEGEDTDRVRAPMPLGRMGRRLQEIAAARSSTVRLISTPGWRRWRDECSAGEARHRCDAGEAGRPWPQPCPRCAGGSAVRGCKHRDAGPCSAGRPSTGRPPDPPHFSTGCWMPSDPGGRSGVCARC
ncbi:Mu transposase domain-containing protein [Cereibacter sphaeroides]|uniref:Mu transposase domain-containing protein n=1 Tax=Cereibacter sphaeroides TaxID=1063 RepID=UPI001F2DD23A|nr:hypothetical protein [Cereibacter sphaeroides]MCE6966987.1 hypothetical protein [Cereibacter sphaeroides]